MLSARHQGPGLPKHGKPVETSSIFCELWVKTFVFGSCIAREFVQNIIAAEACNFFE